MHNCMSMPGMLENLAGPLAQRCTNYMGPIILRHAKVFVEL
uniref:Uncharacterized protein n=1 Tax=Rhizophora mucronata TaxID=61149 RepID=A0A2P2JPL4_RHIMU